MSTSQDDSSYSIIRQKTYINADLNSTLVAQFLFGIYTGVLLAALYIHYADKRAKVNYTASASRIVLWNTIASYGLATLDVAVNWFYTYNLFCVKGVTRATIFKESTTGSLPKGIHVVTVVAESVSFIVADGLLIWRCFHACGGYFHASLVPLGFFALEIVVVLCCTAYICYLDTYVGHDIHQPLRSPLQCYLRAAIYLSVAATSLIATFSICRQICVLTSAGSSARKRYRNVVDALVQSYGLYSLVVTLHAILNLIDTGLFQGSFIIFIINDYAASLTAILGLSPTLMNVRLLIPTTRIHTEALDSSPPEYEPTGQAPSPVIGGSVNTTP